MHESRKKVVVNIDDKGKVDDAVDGGDKDKSSKVVEEAEVEKGKEKDEKVKGNEALLEVKSCWQWSKFVAVALNADSRI